MSKYQVVLTIRLLYVLSKIELSEFDFCNCKNMSFWVDHNLTVWASLSWVLSVFEFCQILSCLKIQFVAEKSLLLKKKCLKILCLVKNQNFFFVKKIFCWKKVFGDKKRFWVKRFWSKHFTWNKFLSENFLVKKIVGKKKLWFF